MKKIAVLMGSDSDLPVVQKAIDTLKAFGVPWEAHVYSAHRTPEEARAFSASEPFSRTIAIAVLMISFFVIFIFGAIIQLLK